MAMNGLLADINIQVQVELLKVVFESATWREVWAGLGLRVFTFPDVGLDREASDDAVWRLCQARQLILVTGNRNEDGPDSLEATLENENTPDSLPVFTLADSEAVRHSKAYAERVAVRALE
jgi:hypothetical protein